MFIVINNGDIKGFCDQPRYVRDKNGCFVQCEKDEATHVAIGGVAYDLSNNTFVREADGSDVTFRESVKLENVNVGLSDSEDALCMLSEEVDARIAEIEDALCELTKEE